MKLQIGYFIIIILLLLSCSKHQNSNSIENENFAFTDFTGEKIEIENSIEYFYTQCIYWEYLEEGNPKFAVRINTTNNELPDDILTDNEGWIYHYLPGADQTIPLSSPLAERSIWTFDNSFEYTFESHVGELSHIISQIEVKYLLNEFESDPISTSFFNYREIGTVLSTVAGDIDGMTISTGTIFIMNEKISDIFVEGLYADHFMYRINIIAEADSTILEEGTWYNSIDCEDIREVEMTTATGNALTPNEDGELTQFEAYIVTRSGYEDIDNPAKMNFKVQEGLYPNTLIYNGIIQNYTDCSNDCYALGENHYVTYIDPALGGILPSKLIDNEICYATPTWIDSEGNYAMIGSDDFQYFIHVGYKGEFIGNYAGNKYLGIVIDETTGINYFSQIVFFDIRLDDQAFIHPELPADEYNIIDNNGLEWLRIPIENELSQNFILENLDYGEHTLTVRAVDMAMNGDQTPSEYTFNLHAPVSLNDREGILILDDSPNNGGSPDDLIDLFYLDIFANYSGNIEALDRQELVDYGFWNSVLHWGKDVFSPTDLQNYKLIVYHSDNPIEGNKLASEYDVLNLYLKNGGNILVSSAQNLYNANYSFIQTDFTFLQDYFGIELDENAINIFANDQGQSSYTQNTFFVSALPETTNGYLQQIDLEYPSFNPIVNVEIFNPCHGLGPVSYFNEDYLANDVTIMYRYGCASPSNEPGWPTQDDYDFLVQQPVALKRSVNDCNCYIFSFPLSYMQQDQVTALMNEILTELGM
ncbi:MAG: hypothetical protein K9N09_11490 [Candidatus Cloacimonetes bacterium]|nr:hypothetical protein [Candidatus Cloacimonadota bacterium]MCF7814898.1 hypothetical protein [Candidatus Cloacimonadota bacterium]MCF7869307.1 hypothetical protein [Candidatus Cloacimonadota bacterium]MCF7884613.1 hypothetical protein [Candidatus Cloacimonadota bacterium]